MTKVVLLLQHRFVRALRENSRLKKLLQETVSIDAGL